MANFIFLLYIFKEKMVVLCRTNFFSYFFSSLHQIPSPLPFKVLFRLVMSRQYSRTRLLPRTRLLVNSQCLSFIYLFYFSLFAVTNPPFSVVSFYFTSPSAVIILPFLLSSCSLSSVLPPLPFLPLSLLPHSFFYLNPCLSSFPLLSVSKNNPY